MGRRRKGRSTRKNPNVKESSQGEDESVANAPHSFVISRGSKMGKYIQDLTMDFRKVMEPYTASDIKARSKNVVKDFAHVAGILKVSHLVMFTKTEKSPYLKIGRFPRGPTMTFRINEYTLARDVRSSLKRQVTHDKQFTNHALLILNNFSSSNTSAPPGENPLGPRQMELMSSIFQNMFPSINITTLKLNTIRRCVLLNYDSSRGLVDFRHYTIKIVPAGLSKQVKKIVNAPTHKIPNLSCYEDVQDYFEGGAASESKAEEDESAQVNVALKRLNQKSSIKLVELGPRLSLEPIKIQEGLLNGDALYHKLQSKTPEEAAKIKEAQRNKMSDKEKRRKEQEKNVRRKEKEKKAANAKAMEGMKNVKKGNHNLPEGFKNAPDSSSEEDNDAEWFQKEVGEAPESDLFDSSKPSGRKRKGGPPMGLPARFNKKFKKDSHRGEQRKGKRPQDVFNNQGVGPNYNKNKVNKGPRVVSKKGRKGKRK
uniref:Suppressor of SWI4 1 homolog n=1 Tax=Caligus rogercresseyi TaxID=217165 RepID=C1BMG6_CALRO|nr:Suppressor of SWI4 1 homolog [Caligus rogercresseyi]